MAGVSIAQPQRKAKNPVRSAEDRKVEEGANEALRETINGLSRNALVPGRKVFIQPTGKASLDKLLAKELKAWGRWEVVVKDEKADLIIKTLTLPCMIIDARTKERLYIAKPEPKENLVKRMQKEIESPPLKTDTSRLTLTKYLQIEKGMTYAEVAKIVGRYGVEQSRSNIGGIETVMYEWRDGIAAINVMFQEGKLVQKAQFGLK
jgi:hypothetical protein